ncbi:hypothetical protein ACE6H2_000510 [Prunus campanulata]
MTIWNHMICIGRIRDIVNLTKSVVIWNRIGRLLLIIVVCLFVLMFLVIHCCVAGVEWANEALQVLGKVAEECSFRKSMMTREQFGLKNRVLRMMFATCITGINLKLSTSPSVQ